MPEDTDQPTLAVTQADIDAAMTLCAEWDILSIDHVAQFLARHRTHSEPRPAAALATHSPAPVAGEDEREVLERAIDRMGWDEIHAFQAELRKGQDIREDAGGYFLRAIRALFSIKQTDTITTYQDAARALVAAAHPSTQGV